MSPAPAPSPEALIRDGIPQALMEFHVARARALRARALAEFGADLARWFDSLRGAGSPLHPRDISF